ncbi:hypothetical protein PTT_20012 [Pyrenophora teres f. teres 0-1]|uniref:Uncharacterized protein n=1 Tax=Pyrenophora teres f. teres (strain 0-1) TaxID=861557 RepID=E3SA82_PYRTT|nr:hypothetical protein PTT_20012 [Pyrenophora teres f. teres 0-1]
MRKIIKGYRPYLSELPPLPSLNSLKLDYPFYNSFKEAEEEHLESYKKTKSWTEVYTYKLDEQSRLKKYKYHGTG